MTTAPVRSVVCFTPVELLIPPIVPHHLLHVVARLAIGDALDEFVGRQRAVALLPARDRFFAAVVRGRGSERIAAVEAHEVGEVRDAQRDVDVRVIQAVGRGGLAAALGNALGRAGQQLHQAAFVVNARPDRTGSPGASARSR